MSGIVCAIRGGPASQPTIACAIALAKENDLPLRFVYVVNLNFLSSAKSSRIDSIARELRQMGEFILISAQSKAAAQGVIADGIVRTGNVQEEVCILCKEIEATHLVVGKPLENNAENCFTEEQLYIFIEKIEKETRAKVILSLE